MDAADARKAAADWMTKATKANEREFNSLRERERRETEAMWPDQGMMWVRKIERWIKVASANGEHGTYEPTRYNPHGDAVIYIGKEDSPIYQKLMQHFRDKGFTVVEFQGLGMKITW